ncbi:DUF397 domain-containing protein [Micromonospora sp. DT233]|uniref:DUF397 domain-containing protein n=1 Tax=Micromonospora sp. DT233 TaxID=3393432 RepID=UPI003CE899B4
MYFPGGHRADRGGACVEVADNMPGVVLVRATKDRDGGTLHFAPGTWQPFLGLAKRLGPAG